jgi:hypothetical protein
MPVPFLHNITVSFVIINALSFSSILRRKFPRTYLFTSSYNSFKNNTFDYISVGREVTQKLAEQLPARQLGAKRAPDKWRCKLCCAEETSVILFARHLMSHYKRSLGHTERLLECHLCHQNFATEKVRIKPVHVHVCLVETENTERITI